MAIYVSQLRRGIKDDATGRNDWASDQAPIPMEGELVLEYDNGVPRLKIGNGKDPFSALPYMSVDSFILPSKVSIVLDPTKWQEVLDQNGTPVSNRYYQIVNITDEVVTPTSQIDLQISPEQVLMFRQKDIAFTAINDGGNIRVCVVGQKPNNEYVIQATITEVVANDIIIGSTTTTPYDVQSLIERIEALENKINNI